MYLFNSLRNCYTNGRIPLSLSYFRSDLTLRALCSQHVESEQKPPRKKTIPIPKITLISDSMVSITTLEEAKKLSKRRDLKLVKIVDMDVKTQRPTYKLMTGTEYHEEELKQREARKKQKNNSFIKGEKLLFLKDSINDHDLEIHCKKILKWIAKSLQVNVVINGTSSNDKLEKIYSFIEQQIGNEGRLLQKTLKGTDLKFHIIPPKKEKKDEL
ncbi:uncharacterized protein LOC123309187 [Coccinella septempunctata]|uniref:uncharacterized protein LOC123309187 n=1 Tax=Coccinella septempunctata TaxID=41139 RepID=UPI001D065D22|nr:uncharacterized protein LOC123309187 [Coccinella septempunctata]